MGARKKYRLKKEKKPLRPCICKVAKCSYFSAKMRLVADMIRGMEVNRALGVLKFSSKEASARVENCCALLLLTGNRKTNVRQKVANCL